ncbi:MAG: hypothetical protein QM731_12375 [Chitinophagaceae bacterium]
MKRMMLSGRTLSREEQRNLAGGDLVSACWGSCTPPVLVNPPILVPWDPNNPIPAPDPGPIYVYDPPRSICAQGCRCVADKCVP